jgi:cytochrome c oxidase subunit 3
MSQRVAFRSTITAQPPISNARLATMLAIATELMLFVGLISGYVVLRFGSNDFAGMARPEIGLTAISTPILLLSSMTLLIAQRAARQHKYALLRTGSMVTLLLGSVFLLVQWIEWKKLMTVGFFPEGSVQSGMFYLLSGVHGAHVFVGLVLLALLSLRSGEAARQKIEGIVTAASLYWHFVTLMWGALWLMIFVM